MPPAARFTPSLLPEQTLEDLFVARHGVLDDCLARILRLAGTGELAAKLIVGPRGSGKTHVISLVYHRARKLPGHGSRFQVAWLPEDPWALDSFDDLIRLAVAALDPSHAPAAGEPLDTFHQAVGRGGPVVVLVENLDMVLAALGVAGRRRLRGLIETEGSLLIIGTAPRLTGHVTGQDEPFYGFFDITALEPFGVDDAADMLTRLAVVNGRQSLSAALGTAAGRRRLAAVAHLAGGQPRIWALLAASLDVQRLDELADTLLEAFDDLTPYYQEQLRQLSPQERKLVRALSAIDGAAPVKDLAAAAGVDQRSAAKAVVALRDRGWAKRRIGPVAAAADGRLTYYELAEPLARLAFQIKESRGEPVRLVVDFLSLWFDASDLAAAGGDPYADAARAVARDDPTAALVHALADPGSSDPTSGLFAVSRPRPDRLAALLVALDEALARFSDGDPAPLLAQPAAVSRLIEDALASGSTVARQRLRLGRLALDAGATGWTPRLRSVLASLIDVGDRRDAETLLGLHRLRDGDRDSAAALLRRHRDALTGPQLVDQAVGLIRALDAELALEVADAAVLRPLPGADRLLLAEVHEACLHRLGRTTEVVGQWRRAVRDLQAARPRLKAALLTARLRLCLAQSRAYDSDVDDGLANLLRDAEQTGDDEDAGRTTALAARLLAAERAGERGDPRRAQSMARRLDDEARERLPAHHPAALACRRAASRWTGEAGDRPGALALSREALSAHREALGFEHPLTLTCAHATARWLAETGQRSAALHWLAEIQRQTDLAVGPDHPDALAVRHSTATWTGETGHYLLAAGLFRALAADRNRVLGERHPDSLAARHHLLRWTAEAGDVPAALDGLARLAAARAEVLGRDHPDTLATRHSIARWTAAAGRPEHAAALLRELLADRERVLGALHPDTLTTRHNLARWTAAAGRPAEGLAALVALLEDRRVVFGPVHPDTLRTRQSIAELTAATGHPRAAAKMLRDLADDRARGLGPTHPDTLETRAALAAALAQAGDRPEARALLEGVIEDQRAVLGPDHPATRASEAALNQL